MRISRSLTIKQMAAVSGVTIITICIFIVIQLFHFVQQRKVDSARQMENIAHTVRQPLADAVLRADVIQAEKILSSLKSAGILSRADVVLPNAFQALHVSNGPERSVPRLASRLFELPVQISVPLYTTSRTVSPKPLAYLVLQADSWPIYQFILNTISTMLTTWLLMALILSVALSWCINRLIIHPLRHIAQEMQSVIPDNVTEHRLILSRLHQDDEIGMLVRSYNRNQQVLQDMYEERVSASMSQDHECHFQAGIPASHFSEPGYGNGLSVCPVKLKNKWVSFATQSQVDMEKGQVIGIELIRLPARKAEKIDTLEWPHNSVERELLIEAIAQQLSYFQQWKVAGTITITPGVPAKMPDALVVLKQLLRKIKQYQISTDSVFIKVEASILFEVPGVMEEINLSGMRLALDYFTPAYTNINKLLCYPFRPGSRINIDAEASLLMNEQVLISLNEITRKLKLVKVAYNVNTNEQRDKLLKCGTIIGQGKLFE